jgi:hypothetical protein
MSDERDDVIDRPRRPGLRELMGQPSGGGSPAGLPTAERASPTAPPPSDEDEALPEPGEEYAAWSRPGNKPWPMVCFLSKGVAFTCLAYANLESIRLLPGDGPGQGPVLMLLFAGIDPQLVRIEGKRLAKLADYLRRHVVAWVRELPTGGGFRQGDAAVITRITFTSPVG